MVDLATFTFSALWPKSTEVLLWHAVSGQVSLVDHLNRGTHILGVEILSWKMSGDLKILMVAVSSCKWPMIVPFHIFCVSLSSHLLLQWKNSRLSSISKIFGMEYDSVTNCTLTFWKYVINCTDPSHSNIFVYRFPNHFPVHIFKLPFKL